MTLTRREFGALPMAAAAHGLELRRKWTVYVVQHSHIDVGYTERQETIAAYHAQFVRQALQFARSGQQACWPPECRFKFTFEGFWQVEQFLSRSSPGERAQLFEAIRGGSLELTAFYFHMTELPDQELLNRSVGFACDFGKREQLPLSAAMSCDVNGFSWGMAEALTERGIRYLSTNINPHHGGYPLGKPLTAFWWEAPSGKRLLVWNGLAYHRANVFGLMGNTAPDSDPGVPGFTLPGTNEYATIRDTSLAERKLLPFLAWLEESGYPYDFLPLMGSGTYTDNSPPNEAYCSILRQWNDRFGAQVQVRSATLGEFFRRLEKEPAGLPVHRGEWTDWWSDGEASAPDDTLLYRNALRTRRLITRLDPGGATVPAAELEAIDRKLLLYGEHTFGYSRTATPSLLSQQIFKRKSKHAIDADELAGAAMFRILRKRGEGEFAAGRPSSYQVLNSTAEAIRAVASLPVDFFEAPLIDGGFAVVDDQGRRVPRQAEPSPRGWMVHVPVELTPLQQRGFRLEAAPKEAPPAAAPASGFENEFYSLTWSVEQGINSFLDRATGMQLLAAERKGGLGCPVYQVFPGGNRWGAGRTSGARVRPAESVTFGTCTGVRRTAAGPILERWEFSYSVPGATETVLEICCYRGLPQIELTLRTVKTDVIDPEGLYAYFPLEAPEGRWHLDKPGSIIRPGIDQLPGTCCDYYSLQHGAALAGRGVGIAWATLDAPLVQLGALNLWRYTVSSDGKGSLYSWLTNNKWETNFRMRCGGAYAFRYRIEAGAPLGEPGIAIARCAALSYPPLVMRA